jgi:NADPH-dependent glutamate synthase beta subunit-like oxidoreductase
MGTLTGFMEYERLEEGYLPVPKRVKNHKEFVIGLKEDEAKVQTARCMDCGTPFCIGGCPVNNIIPTSTTWSYRSEWKHAFEVFGRPTTFRVHRTHLSGAVRSCLYAQCQRRSGRHQEHRARDHRSRLG